MALTELGRQLTEVHRQRQLSVRAALVADILAVWPLFDLDNIDGTWPPVAAAIVAAVELRRRESGEEASSYYRRFRDAEGLPDGYEPEPVAETDRSAVVGTLFLLGPIGAKRQILRRRPDVAGDMLTRVAGSASRLVLDAGRQTLMAAVSEDPRAQGWSRVTDSDPCDYCADLAADGVFADDATFRAHDHCGCTAEPVLQDPQTVRASAPDSEPLPLDDDVAEDKIASWTSWAEGQGWDVTVSGREVTGTRPGRTPIVWRLTETGTFRVERVDRAIRR